MSNLKTPSWKKEEKKEFKPRIIETNRIPADLNHIQKRFNNEVRKQLCLIASDLRDDTMKVETIRKFVEIGKP